MQPRWPEATPTRSLSKSDFDCIMPNIVRGLNAAIENLYTEFRSDLQAAAAEEELPKNVKTLDPTQLEVYKYIALSIRTFFCKSFSTVGYL